jgi:hypothetical protein
MPPSAAPPTVDEKGNEEERVMRGSQYGSVVVILALVLAFTAVALTLKA